MVVNATSTIFELYSGSRFHWWRIPEYPEKTTDLSQITDKLYHINKVGKLRLIPNFSEVIIKYM